MALLERFYTLGLHALDATLPLLGRGEGKFARGVRGRQGAEERLVSWGVGRRDPDRPLVWFHAPSVGEGLQARAVIEALRARRPDLQIAYTYFSPSAVAFAAKFPVDVADYLPIDLPRRMGRVLDALAPRAVVFSKSEVWPNLTVEAELRGIPTFLLSATLPAGSSRLRWPARSLLAPAHRCLARVGAISPADAGRFRMLGVPPDRLVVTGDPRFDQVVQRARATRSTARSWSALLSSAVPTIVAGSTWPEDHARLIPAVAAIPDVRLIAVPHEPTETQLVELERLLLSRGLFFARLSSIEHAGEVASTTRVVVVDRVGVLGELYSLADIAYVGGGFGSAGLHSVLEPAAYAAPVLFGPRHANAREAAELVRAGGALSLRDAEAVTRAIRHYLDSPDALRSAGEAARRYVEAGTGAADKSAAIVLDVVGHHNFGF